MTRSPRQAAIAMALLALLGSLLVVTPPAVAQAAAVVGSAKGPPANSVPGVRTKVETFRELLGDDNGLASAALQGRREVTWDEVADADAAPAHLPADHYVTTIPKGLRLDGGDPALTGASGFMVSATEPAATTAATEFGNLNGTYRTAFTTFADDGGGRLFTALGTTTLDIEFFVAGTDTPGAVSGFGAVFVDVDQGSASRLEAFGADGELIGSTPVPSATGNEGLSFAGLFLGSPVVTRVRLTLGTDATETSGAPNDGGQLGPGDVVVLDNVLYGEPQQIAPEPPAVVEGTNPWEVEVASGVATGDPVTVRSLVNPLLSALTSAIGGSDNTSRVGTQPAGWRVAGFDEIDPVERHPSRFPGGWYHTIARRGVVLQGHRDGTRSTTLAVADPAALAVPPAVEGFAQSTDTPPAMTSLNAAGAVAFSPQRTTIQATFTVPGSGAPGVVAELGVVLADVDLAGLTSIELYDIEGDLLHRHGVAAELGAAGLSVATFRFAIPMVHRVVLTLGNGLILGTGEQQDISEGGAEDLVALDRLVFSEPHIRVDADLIGLEDSGTDLHVFNTLDTTDTDRRRITGLEPEDRLVAMDRDQVTGTVFGLGARGTLYCLQEFGAARLVGRLTTALDGLSFGLDHDAISRRLVVVSDEGQHLRVNRFEGSSEPVDAYVYASGDELAGEVAGLTALALTADGTGWGLDGQRLVAVDGDVVRSAGQIATDLPAATTLEHTAEDDRLWTVTDAFGPGLVMLDPATATAQRVGSLVQPMIGLVADGEFGPCPTSPVAVSSAAAIDGGRITLQLDVVNDGDGTAPGVELTGDLPVGLALAGVDDEDCTVTPPASQDSTQPAVLRCAFGDLAVGTHRTVQVRARIGGYSDPDDLLRMMATASVAFDGIREDADHTSLLMALPPAGFALPEGPLGSASVVDTAVQISALRFDDADLAGGRHASHVVVGRVDSFADALAGSALTGDAPLLFSAVERLSTATLSEIDRVLGGSGRVYLLGGEVALSTDVEGGLVAAGYEIVRLSGPSRVETAVAVAREVRALYGPTTQVLLARGFGPADNPTAAWADSVAGGGFAADRTIPVLLTMTDSLHPAVEAFMAEDATGQAVLLGGTAALGQEVADAVPGAFRVFGDNRAATAAAIATDLWRQLPDGPRRYLVINAGTEDGWAFGLAAAGLAADTGAPLIAVVGDVVPPETEEAVDSCFGVDVDLLAIGSTQLSTTQFQRLDSLDTGIC